MFKMKNPRPHPADSEDELQQDPEVIVLYIKFEKHWFKGYIPLKKK